MTLSPSMVVTSLMLLVACDAAGPAEPVATPERVAPTSSTEPFAPREVTVADFPPDIHEGSWARLPTVARESLSPEDQRAFDVVVNPDSRYAAGLRGPLGMWMYSPRLAELMFPASSYLRYGVDGSRDQRLTELAILTVSRELDSQYEWSAHEPLARDAGLEDGIIDLLRTGRPVTDADAPPGLGERERTIIRVARELVNEPKLSREAFVAAQALFGNDGLMDLAGLVGYYTFVNYTIKTFDVQRAPGSLLLLPMP